MVDSPGAATDRGEIRPVALVGRYEPDGVEMEFVTGAGRTRVVVTVSVDDVRPIEERDVLAVGPLDEER